MDISSDFKFAFPYADIQTFHDAYTIAADNGVEDIFVDMSLFLLNHFEEEDRNMTDISIIALEYLGLFKIKTEIDFLQPTI